MISLETRAALVTLTTEIVASSRRGGTCLLALDSSAEDISAWLQWCDPNGCHTAELAASQGEDPYTLEQAWTALLEMVEWVQ